MWMGSGWNRDVCINWAMKGGRAAAGKSLVVVYLWDRAVSGRKRYADGMMAMAGESRRKQERAKAV